MRAAALALILALGLVACAGATPLPTLTPTPSPIATPTPATAATPTPTAPPKAAWKVIITNFSFQPALVTISPGQMIEWVNMPDSVAHTVTGQGFDSGVIGRGGSWIHTFTTPGDFPYGCSIHPSMKGTVRVR